MIYLNNTPINSTLFPDNTSQVWKLSPESLSHTIKTNTANVVWEFSHEGEFLQLAQLKHLLDIEFAPDIVLKLKYLPYGRQDKNVDNNATFALHTFAKLLNTLNFEVVIIQDPHSEIALNLIQNSIATYPIGQIHEVKRNTESDLFCYPDKGAVTKYTKIYKSMPYIYGEKVRDQSTGNILSYEVIGDCKDKNVLIVDDICDGGMTFKILAKDLLEKGAKEVNLFVTHGIFSKGLRTLTESGIKRVFTVDGEIGETQNHITYRRL